MNVDIVMRLMNNETDLGRPPIKDRDDFHIAADRRAQQFYEQGIPLAAIFIDLNHLKPVNDTYGHAEGDRALDGLRDVIQNQFRQLPGLGRAQDVVERRETHLEAQNTNDIVPSLVIDAGRLGGDEFCVLCDTDDSGAIVVSERIRQTFDEFIASPGNEHLKDSGVSLAIGVSVMQPGMDVNTLLSLADQEMYLDKYSQLKPLNTDQEQRIREFFDWIGKQEIRLRDLGKYAILLGLIQQEK